MNYLQSLDRLYQASFTLVPPFTLDRAHALDSALGHPAASFPTVHVAGSNGKGSVSWKIAKALELSGLRVGLYTSPHLFSFTERISINGQSISEQDVVAGLEPLFALDEQLKLDATFFELATFLAFDYFRKAKVDAAVIETGLGGRLDATNVINPVLSVITSISREHSQLLGEEIEQIAAEKAGIIKPGVPVVIGPKARCQSILDRAEQLSCPLFSARKISYFYDEENSATASLAIQHLPFSISPDAAAAALAVRPPCRFEKIGEAIFDVAHNPEAVFNLLQALHTFYPHGKFRFLVGFSRDKEYAPCLELIADVATHIHLVRAPMPRAAALEELQGALKNEDPALVTSHPSILEGAKEAYALALAKGEVLVVCGSFYIMSDAKEAVLSGLSLAAT